MLFYFKILFSNRFKTLMMKHIVFVVVLLVGVVATIHAKEFKCKHSKCPSDCEFGNFHVKAANSSECVACICNPNPCESMICPNDSSCQIYKKYKCHSGNCKHEKIAKCFLKNKPGNCPKASSAGLNHKSAKKCMNDAECRSHEKCCNATCVAPCFTNVNCTCEGSVKPVIQTSIDGCQVCKCGNEKSIKNRCDLPKETGRCKAHIKRYYYSREEQKCKEFFYGGCGGNENNFYTKDHCLRECSDKHKDKEIEGDVCKLSPDAGPCEAFKSRFYYDSVNKTCREFNYGGCQGNANNFKSSEDCQQKCVKTPKIYDQKKTVCTLPKSTGNCKASFLKFYYDAASGSCKEFYYTGCGGNDNRWNSKEQCKNACEEKDDDDDDEVDVCNLPKRSGLCMAYFPRYYYNAKNKTCEEFIYGGCDGNANNFQTLYDCETKCQSGNLNFSREIKSFGDPKTVNICELPKSSGDCKAKFKKYYYDAKSKSCKDFDYSGCGGNENRFESKEACTFICQSEKSAMNSTEDPKKQEEDVCGLPKEIGPCRASLPRFYYDNDSKSCKEFKYGGCKGNDNNFKTLNECKSRCETKNKSSIDSKDTKDTKDSKDPKNPKNPKEIKSINATIDVCTLPKSTGSCRASFTKYYYDSASKSCKNFTYSGCEGNANRFDSADLCNAVCQQSSKNTKNATVEDDTCSLPKVTGKCRASFERYYYNSTTKSCQKFIYSGCEANKNNFHSLSDCEHICVKKSGSRSNSEEDEDDDEYEEDDDHHHLPTDSKNSNNTSHSYVCSLPLSVGLCRASIPKYYFDSTTKTCKTFNFSGCGGNSNRFDSEAICEELCMLKEAKQTTSPARATTKSSTKPSQKPK